MKTISIFLSIVFLMTLPGFAQEQDAQNSPRSNQIISKLISYQGILTDDNGASVTDGEYQMIYSLYESETGTPAVWSETQTVLVTSGVFSVYLGSVTPITHTFDKQLWLGVAVQGGAEMTPRLPLTSSAYSMRTHSVIDGVIETASIADGAVTQEKLHPTVSLPPGGTAGGDLTGSFPNPVVVGLQGRAVEATTPESGQTLKWTGTAWSPAADEMSLPFIGSTDIGTRGISVQHTATEGNNSAVHAQTSSNAGTGVYGEVTATSGTNYGVHGKTVSPDGYAGFFQGRLHVSDNVGIGILSPDHKLHVNGLARFDLPTGSINISTPGGWPGLIAFSQNGHRRDIVYDDTGLFISASSTSSAPSSTNGFNLKENGNIGIGTYDPTHKLDIDGQIRIRGGSPGVGKILTSDANGVGTWTNLTGGLTLPYEGSASVGSLSTVFKIIDNGTGTAITGQSYNGTGIFGQGQTGIYGLYTSGGHFGKLGQDGLGVYGWSLDGKGVSGETQLGVGVFGKNTTMGTEGYVGGQYGMRGQRGEFHGYLGYSDGGVLGRHASGYYGYLGMASYAGYFSGPVQIYGTLTATGTKNFRIDHPLDPLNRELWHASVESNEVLNVYCGNIVTNLNGEATVEFPDWFESVNTDFRYQLTVIGTFAQAIISRKIENNRFVIGTDKPGVEVSWQVTARRNDVGMRLRPFSAERNKPSEERGSYLDPEAWGFPIEHRIY